MIAVGISIAFVALMLGAFWWASGNFGPRIR